MSNSVTLFIVVSTGIIGLLTCRMMLIIKFNRLKGQSESFSNLLIETLRVWSYDLTDEPSELLKEIYRVLLIVNACLVCLAHGSNDVANSIAPLIVLLDLHSYTGSWPYWLGGLGIAAGLLCLGHIVMETIGKKVLKMDFYKGFSC